MIAALLLLLLGLALTAAIIAANGYFVAQEFAYMSVDRVKLRARADAGDTAAARALKVTRRTSFMLSGAQLGITVTGLLIGFIAQPFIGQAVGDLLGGAGVPTAAGVAIGTIGALVLATVVQMIFGELYPKNLAIANPDALSRGLARSTLIYLTVFGWLIRFFDASANAVLRLVRVAPVHDVDASATAEDLEHIIEDSRLSGDLSDELSMMLDRIIEFPEQDVDHAMIPRVRVGVVAPDLSIAEVRVLMAREHTRYPVIGEQGEPVGVVQLNDVLTTAPDDDRPVSAIMRPPLVVPTLMRLPDALALLTTTHNEMACVIDEYGGFAGVLTVEDLAEELVGEITDEHDPDDVAGAACDEDGTWRIDGDLHVDEVERAIGRDLPRGDYETLAGLVIAEAGELPEVGQRFRVPLPVDGADFVDADPGLHLLDIEIIEVERFVPRTLAVRLVQEPFGSESATEVPTEPGDAPESGEATEEGTAR